MKSNPLFARLLPYLNDRRFWPFYFLLAVYFFFGAGNAVGKFLYYVVN